MRSASDLASSFKTRVASDCANSTNAPSFNRVRACRGVLERGRRVQALKTIRAVKDHQRWMRRGAPEKSVHAATIPIFALTGHPFAFALARVITPSGCGGKTLGPPIFAFSNPLALRPTSRTISASSRSRACRASSLLFGQS